MSRKKHAVEPNLQGCWYPLLMIQNGCASCYNVHQCEREEGHMARVMKAVEMTAKKEKELAESRQKLEERKTELARLRDRIARKTQTGPTE